MLDAESPIDAEMGHLTVSLKPINGKWLLDNAAFTDVQSPFLPMSEPQLPKLPVSAEALAKAAEHWQNFYRAGARFNPDKATESDKGKLLPIMTQSVSELDGFAKALKLPEVTSDSRRLADVMQQLTDLLEKQGVAAMKAESAKLQKSTELMQVGQRLSEIGAMVLKSADDAAEKQAEASPKGSRPPAIEPDIERTLGWDGTKVQFPGPLKIPPWLRETPAFKLWQQQQNIKTFHTRDDAGNSYEVHCMGGAIKDGKHYEMIPSIRMFRPDGTLSAVTQFEMNGLPTTWLRVDETGKLITCRVTASTTGGVSKIERVRRFDKDGNQTTWSFQHRDPQQSAPDIIWLEEWCNPIGKNSRVTHRFNPKPMKSPTTEEAL